MGGVEVALRPEFCWLPRGPCFWGRGGAAAGGCLLPDLNEEEAAAASGAKARGAWGGYGVTGGLFPFDN